MLVVALLMTTVAVGLVDRTSIGFNSSYRVYPVTTIILHHTGGSTIRGAESVLLERGLSYHYMIDRDGKVYKYVNPNRKAFHALGYNVGTIGISFVGGGKYGDVTDAQRKSVVNLCISLKKDFKYLKYITGHRDVSPGRKPDPQVKGNYKVWISNLAKEVGLKYG